MRKHVRGIASLLIAGLIVVLLAACGASQKQHKQAEAHYFLGVSYLREQNPSRALKEFLRGAEVDPRNPEIQAGLGQTYQLKKAYDKAENHYLRALELAPGDSEIKNNLGALYLDMERWNDAIRCFRRASSDLTFNHPEIALTGMGYAYFQKGAYLEAVSSYQKAIGYDPLYPRAHLRLGEAYYALDKTDKALEAFEQALVLAPRYAFAYYKLGLARMKLGEIDRAREAFQEVAQLTPSSEIGKEATHYLELLQ